MKRWHLLIKRRAGSFDCEMISEPLNFEASLDVIGFIARRLTTGEEVRRLGGFGV